MSDPRALEAATELPIATSIEASPENGGFEAKPNKALSPRQVDESDVELKLREYADKIRALRKLTVDSICDIGRWLSVAKNIVGRGRWLPWLKEEFDWTDSTATNFIRVYDMVAKRNFANFAKLSFPISSLYLLAAPGTPDAARDAVLKQAEAGQPVTVAGVKAQIASAKGSVSKSAVEKKPQLNSLAWSEANQSERIKFIDAVGPDNIINTMTQEQMDLVTVSLAHDDEERDEAEESVNPALLEEDDRTGMPKILVRDAKAKAKAPAALPEPDPRSEPTMQQAVAGIGEWLKFFTPAVQHEICNRAIAGLGEPM